MKRKLAVILTLMVVFVCAAAPICSAAELPSGEWEWEDVMEEIEEDEVPL